MRSFVGFLRKTHGLTTVEWVAITAVVLAAALGITAFVLEGADGLGGAVAGRMCAEAENIDPNVDCD
jgi:hypothetical protein